MNAKHKPTPWEARGDSIYLAGKAGRIDSRVLFTFVGQGVSGEHTVDCATASFIVRACNAHDELVAKAEALIEALDASDLIGACDFGGQRVELEQAIAKAKGGAR